MTLQIDRQPHILDVNKRAQELLSSAVANGKKPVLLVNSYSDATAWKKRIALSDLRVGCKVTTFSAWIEDVWQLYGDGKKLIQEPLRSAFVMQILHEHEGLEASPGLVKTVAHLAQEFLPELRNAETLSPVEHLVVEATQAYSALLDEKGFIEESQAVDLLCSTLPSLWDVVVVDAFQDALPKQQEKFYHVIGATIIENEMSIPSPVERSAELIELQKKLFAPDPHHPIQAQGAVQFAFAAGPSAENQLIINTLVDVASKYKEGRIGVSSKDPALLFENIAPRLQAHGIGCSCAARRRVLDTDIGRTIAQIIKLTAHDIPDTFFATDYSFNLLSGIPTRKSFAADERWRKNRLVELDDILTDLSADAPVVLQGVIGSFENGREEEGFDALTAFIMQNNHCGEAYQSEQLTALASIRSFYEVIQKTGGTPLDVLALMKESTVNTSRVVGDGRVEIQSVEGMARQEPASYQVLLLSDMTTQSYPLSARGGALQELLGKLGLASQQDPLLQARRAFYQALETSQEALIVERSLMGESADATYPSFIYEEIVDCYRTSLTDSQNLDKTFSLTEELRAFALPASGEQAVVPLGEHDVVSNMRGYSKQVVLAESDLPAVGLLDADSKTPITTPCTDEATLKISPSAIEVYQSCPYKWFVERRLKKDTPDEGFDARQQGTFAHEALQVFYEQFTISGHRRVTEQTLDEALKLFDQAFDKVAQAEFEKPYKKTRYLPQTPWEHHQREAIKGNLQEQITRECAYFPTYEPTYFEWEFGEEEPYSYAGAFVEGKVDRIDVDPATNRAVVIDYKTGLSNIFDLHPAKEPDEFELPLRVQGLIYAKAVQDILGYSIAAVLYVNPLNGEVRGGYDSAQIGPEQIPGLVSSKRCNVPYGDVRNFEDLLAKTEESLEEFLVRLKAKDIAPDPRNPKLTCRYCPAVRCDKRQS